eukprot:g19821.t1
MSSSQQIASFRKVSAGILASAHLASQEDRPKVTKKEISLVLKRVAPALGIDGTAYHVLDILLGLVQPDDFQAGRRPVVAISNQRLAEYTRRTTRTVTRCLKKLVEAGVLAYRDSPTGRRYVYRGSEGALEQAYGLDFSPACFNLEAFKAQADAFQRRIKAEQEARRAVTRFSRAIADMAELEPAEFHGFAARAQSSACSSVQAETGVSLSSWPALCGAAEQLRMLIGLSPAGYQLAVERQGRYLAAACLAVVAEKALRDPEHIASPGGYFRAMIDRAGEGKLHLHKSLHGLV